MANPGGVNALSADDGSRVFRIIVWSQVPEYKDFVMNRRLVH